MKAEVKETSGAAFYIYISDHIFRVIGDMNTLTWGKDFPKFKIVNDSLKILGTLKDQVNAKEKLLTWLNNTNTINHFNVDLKKIFQKKEALEIATKLILESKNKFNQIYPESKFYVIIWPEEEKDIIPYLNDSKINYIEIEGDTYEKIHLKDNHPTFNCNKKIASEIIKKMNHN